MKRTRIHLLLLLSFLLFVSAGAAIATPCNDCWNACDFAYYGCLSNAQGAYQECIRDHGSNAHPQCLALYIDAKQTCEVNNSKCHYIDCVPACGELGEDPNPVGPDPWPYNPDPDPHPLPSHPPYPYPQPYPGMEPGCTYEPCP